MVVTLAVVGGLAGCGTVKEKTAPCKRPANLLSYASEAVSSDTASGCGPMRPINSRNTAGEAIKVLTAD